MKRDRIMPVPAVLGLATVFAFAMGLLAGWLIGPRLPEAGGEIASAGTQTLPEAPAPRPVVVKEESAAALIPAPRVVKVSQAAPAQPKIRPFAVPHLAWKDPPPDPAQPAQKPVAPHVPVAAQAPLNRLAVVHTLRVRLDLSSGDQIERELLLVPELDLDNKATPYLADELFTTARANARTGLPAPSIVLACKLRPDLAGLPFRVGVEATLPKERADAMHARSRYLRRTYETLITRKGPPTPDELFTVLTDKRLDWAGPESVPCIQQILLAENEPTRRMSCELLHDLPTPESTAALVRLAIFDPEPGNRAAAVDALRERKEASVVPLFVRYLRYPWPRAVEHVGEALIALKAQSAIPYLAEAYDLPDPDAAFQVRLPGDVGGNFRRELVRVNHARNCTMCHTPSLQKSDQLRASAPIQTETIPAQALLLPPRMTTGYYAGVKPASVKVIGPRRKPYIPTFVSATTTYLRQDFSLDQPVANPGLWPARQRYDYFLRYSPGAGGPVLRKPEESPYRRAIGLTIRHLSGHDPDLDKEWLRDQKTKSPVIEDLAGAIARVMLLTSYPNALTSITELHVADKLMNGKAEDVEKTVERLQAASGTTAARLALIAFLDPLTRSADAAVANRAGRLLGVARGPFLDKALAAAMRKALHD